MPTEQTTTHTEDRTAVRSAKEMHDALMAGGPVDKSVVSAFLRQQISASAPQPIDLPDDLAGLIEWSRAHVAAVGEAYHAYLEERKAGAPRRYFTNRSHALYFIRAVAPTKLVDGAWLYGTLAHWDNPASRGLIRTYLEELGDGVPAQNHVALYQKLLAANDCDDAPELSDDHYLQGAIQLALAFGADEFLPEVIGYNLGYEQLPLHLLICGYELNELGIDPYYFTLHVTIDNANNGHANKAIAAIGLFSPKLGDADDYARRIRDGYRLNEIGASTLSVIAEFDLQAELVDILAAKSEFGKNMHSDYCRVAGRSVNDWLSERANIPDFLQALVTAGWIQRGEPAANSRFWQLVQGPRAEMFGVFSAYELQVLQDWIATVPGQAPIAAPRTLSHRAQMRMLERLAKEAPARKGGLRELAGLTGPAFGSAADPALDAEEARLLEERLGAMANKAEVMGELQGWMAPHRHFTPLGLHATRMYARLLDA